VNVAGLPFPTPTVSITNLYDLYAAEAGALAGWNVRGVGVRGAVVDTGVLSLELPADTVELLGLTADRPGSRRLSPVRVRIRDRQATIEPFASPGNRVVLGHMVLTALGLKYDPGWGLMDDDYPSR
jgi:hypothetical protein